MTKPGDEMVERVARALCVADRVDPDADSRVVGNTMADVHLEDPRNCASYQYVKRALAAIAAHTAGLAAGERKSGADKR